MLRELCAGAEECLVSSGKRHIFFFLSAYARLGYSLFFANDWCRVTWYCTAEIDADTSLTPTEPLLARLCEPGLRVYCRSVTFAVVFVSVCICHFSVAGWTRGLCFRCVCVSLRVYIHVIVFEVGNNLGQICGLSLFFPPLLIILYVFCSVSAD